MEINQASGDQSVESRLKFKILTPSWKALNDMGSAYIKSILNVKMGRTGLRSGVSTILEVPKTN